MTLARMFIAFGLIATILYAAAAAMLFRRIGVAVATGEAEPADRPTPIMPLWGAALTLHAAALYLHTFTADGVNLGLFNAISTVAWLAALIVLISSLTRPLEILGVALLPLASLSILAEVIFRDLISIAPLTDSGLATHIIISFVAYSILFIAAVQAILLAIQNRYLHGHHPGGYIRALPPLTAMESLLFRLIALGFAALSLGLLTGFLFLEDIFDQHLVHKTVLSIVAWGVFGILLWGHWQLGWRGRTAVRWTLGGFSVLLLAYLGSKVVIELILGR